MDLDRETRAWVDAGIISAEQRARILARYPGGAADSPRAAAGDGADGEGEESGVSLAVLAILWAGGALVFLGLAFLLGILWDKIGFVRALVLMAFTAAFFAGGAALLRRRPELEKTGMALLVIGVLLFPGTFGVTYEDLFGSSGHYMGLIAITTAVYALLAVKLRSRAFSVLGSLGCFWAGLEVIRDSARWGPVVPLVQLGIVDRLEDVFGIVFLTVALLPFGLSFLAGRDARFAHLRGTLFVSSFFVGLLPADFGGLNRYEGLNSLMAIGASLAAIVASVLFRQRRAFWVAGGSLVIALLVLFGSVFKDSIAFTIFAILLGLVTMGAGAYLSIVQKTWLDRLFALEVWKTAPSGGEPAAGAPETPPGTVPERPAPEPGAPPT